MCILCRYYIQSKNFLIYGILLKLVQQKQLDVIDRPYQTSTKQVLSQWARDVPGTSPEGTLKVLTSEKKSSGVASRFFIGVSRSGLLQLHLAISVTGFVESTEPGLVWEKFQLHFISCLLELLAAEYLRETGISIFKISFIVFCSLDALKKALKKKETRRKMEIIEMLQQTAHRRKRSG